MKNILIISIHREELVILPQYTFLDIQSLHNILHANI